MKSQPLKNGMTPLIQLRRSWWTITTCLREVIYWKGSTKSNSQTLTCYCSEWRRTPSGFYFGTAQAEWFWGWLDVSQLHFLNVFIPKTFLCLLHTPFGIRSPRYWWWFRPGRSWYWISPTSLVVAQTLGYESWRHQLRCRLPGGWHQPGRLILGSPTNMAGLQVHAALTGTSFVEDHSIYWRPSGLGIFHVPWRILVEDDGCKRLVQIRVLGNMCFVWMFLGTPKYHK